MHDARNVVKERIEKGRAFALYVGVNHLGGVVTRALPFVAEEIMQTILSLVGSVTLAELLEKRQRFVEVERVKDLQSRQLDERGMWMSGLSAAVLLGFPSVGATDVGYLYRTNPNMSSFCDGQMSVSVEQRVKKDASEPMQSVIWTIGVDLRQVCLKEGAKELLIPATAVTVTTNVDKHAGHLQLTRARVEEMLAFKPTGRITDNGNKMRFEDGALAFEVLVKWPVVVGRTLNAHMGFKVGDLVRLTTSFNRYQSFAVGQQGVIRDIRKFHFALYFVELADESLAGRTVNAHKKAGGPIPGQVPHHVTCRHSHLMHWPRVVPRFSPEP
jgi:hypothetical protein